MNEREPFLQVGVRVDLALCLAVASMLVLPVQLSCGMDDGTIRQGDRRLFPIGSYELPKEDGKLALMAEAGINLFRCNSRTDLDRVQALGALGWMPLALQNGVSEALRQQVEAVKDHPALALWEGPDELVEGFTDHSSLWKTKGIYDSAQDWWKQTPKAVKYAEGQAQKIMPRLREAIRWLRSLDDRNRQIWFNESNRADVRLVRQYVEYIDITGCDIYPVKKMDRPISVVGAAVDRWKQLGRGKPVWMVLQAFSWHELGDYYGTHEPLYPSFSQSRFMAYDAIVHGAAGIMYFGSDYLQSEDFRQSLLALTSELAALQPFLIAPEAEDIQVRLIEIQWKPAGRGVKVSARQAGQDRLIILVNEDDNRHMGVELSGLDFLNGKVMHLLYGQQDVTIQRGELVTRMQPYEVQVFCTSRKWESKQQEGREFGQGNDDQ